MLILQLQIHSMMIGCGGGQSLGKHWEDPVSDRSAALSTINNGHQLEVSWRLAICAMGKAVNGGVYNGVRWKMTNLSLSNHQDSWRNTTPWGIVTDTTSRIMLKRKRDPGIKTAVEMGAD